MKNNGKIFEKDIENSFDKSIYVLRMNDSGSSFSGGSGSRFTPESPYDYIVYNQNNREMLCLELKSTNQSSISMVKKDTSLKYLFYCKKKDKENIKIYKKQLNQKSIKFHQIMNLYKAYSKGCSSYFIFNFENRETYALHIIDFLHFWNNTNKSSININDIVRHNGISISKTNKNKSKIHYIYDVSVLFNNKRKDVLFWQKLLIAKDMYKN